MTNLRKIAMAVAIIAVFTTFVGCGKTQQEAVEATTEQVADDTQEQAVADDTQEQAVEATTQEQAAEAATEQAVEANTQEQAIEETTEEATAEEVVTYVDFDGIILEVHYGEDVFVLTPEGVEVTVDPRPEKPLKSGHITKDEIDDEWKFILIQIRDLIENGALE